MSLEEARHQKPKSLGRTARRRGEAESKGVCDEASAARHGEGDSGPDSLLSQALARENLVIAWKRVKANKGSAGVDGLSINDTIEYLKLHWPNLRTELLTGRYRPRAVRRVQIPKSGGGVRELGIPTVTDRLMHRLQIRKTWNQQVKESAVSVQRLHLVTSTVTRTMEAPVEAFVNE